jgi:tetratricopeptide (TPR) repeat protein
MSQWAIIELVGVWVISRSKRRLLSWQRQRIRQSVLLPCILCAALATVAADSREALQNAASLVQHGQLAEADQQAHLALSDPNTRAAACSVLGTIRFQQKRLAESAGFLQEALRLEPSLLGARLSLAEVYTLQKKPQQANELYRQVLDLDPSNTVARFALAQAENEKGNYRQSLDLAKPALDVLKQSPQGSLLLATDFIKVGETSSAAALAEDWARLPNVPPALSIKFGLLLARAGLGDEAVSILQRVEQGGSPTYELAFNLAGAYLLKKDAARALEYYDQALSLNPKSIPALEQAAAITEAQGELEHSLSYWIRARKIEPDNPDVLLGFGRVCLKMDLLDDAEPALKKAASLRPGDAASQYTLAAAEVGKKQFAAAQALIEGLLQKKPGNPQLQYALGSVLYLEGHLDEAASHLRESIRLQPDQLAPYYYLALVARDQGNDADAVQRLQDLLRRYPDHALSCEVLGGLLVSAHRYDEAETNLENAVRLNPKSVKANYQLGLLLSRIGKKDEADKRLEIAKSLRTQDETNSRLQLRLLDPDQ